MSFGNLVFFLSHEKIICNVIARLKKNKQEIALRCPVGNQRHFNVVLDKF
jgi:hypothetical protein